MRTTITVSIRSLIEYSLKTGSIGFEYGGEGGMARAWEGAQLHRRLQKKRQKEALAHGWEYVSEAAFSRSFDMLGLEITVRGRADGIIKKDGKVFIEEIKTTEKPLDTVMENHLHMAQAKCYAYLFSLENETAEIYALLTYLNAEEPNTKEFEYRFSFEELEAFFTGVLEKYAKWAAFIMESRDKRDITSAALVFPYENYRHQQRDMCVWVYRAIERKKPVFISAPTGIGKTVSTLFPAIKSLPSGKTDKIFYLTAKTVTRKTALDAVMLMHSKGLLAKTLVITAKDKACFMEKRVCEASSCPYANGHFDRVNEALYDILGNEDIMPREVIEGYARKHNVCPYEFSLDVALYSDIIICDYNYAFDPRAYLRRFFAETSENYVFLIDEAHNLVERAREMFSAEISLRALKGYTAKIGKKGSDLKHIIKRICGELEKASDKIESSDYGLTYNEPPRKILNDIREYCREADKWLTENRNKKRAGYYEDILELYFEFNHFLSISDIFDEKFVCYIERESGARLRLFCLDPSGLMETRLKNASSAILFSATLTPLDYFKRLLGAKPEDYAITLPSPFPEENLGVFAVHGISAKYRDREHYYGDIADYIYITIQARAGNYFAFFPSYVYLESVYKVFSEKYPGIETAIQTPEMGEAEKERFLEQFDIDRGTPLVCFAVLGGMFGEGIDLPGEKLIGAFIISVGLPKISFERLLISNYFGGRGANSDNEGSPAGFEYAYMYPGMNKVLQAGGRVIRTMADKGVIVLMDSRFSQRQYSSLFPESWKGVKAVRGREDMERMILEFWTEKD